MNMLTQIGVAGRVRILGTLLLTLTLVSSAVLMQQQWQARRQAAAALQALAPAAEVLRLVQRTQEHRGLTAGVLGGNAGFKPRREAKQQEVDQALASALAAVAAPSTRLVAYRDQVQSAWQSLSASIGGASIKGPESFTRHTALVQQQLQWLDELVHGSGLGLDPSPQVNALVLAVLTDLPQLTEVLGQLRARGSVFITQGGATSEDKVFLSLRLGAAREYQARGDVDLQRAADADPQHIAALQGAMDTARQATAAAQALVQTELIAADKPGIDATAYFARVTQAMDAQYALARHSFDALEAVLREREQAATRGLWTIGIAATLLLVLVSTLVSRMLVSVRRHSQTAIEAARQLAAGNFGHRAGAEGHDEFAQIVHAIDVARDAMAQAVGSVRQGVETVAQASGEIAQASLDLSNRTESQASSLQQTAAAMDQLSGALGSSTQHAREASRLAGAARDAAASGGQVVQSVVATMQDIACSSQRMADIVGVIDQIAFQTNLLALNAAVEAARAGESGRGFAVVASEVRGLAGRSAQAAREIKQMIGSSIEKVESGSKLTTDAGRAMDSIVEQVRRVTELIERISHAAHEQSSGLTQINGAVSQMDQMTQQNAALVEQSAAAAQSLKDQAQRLAQAMDAFRLEANAR